jgi:hypothetical protein
VSDVLLVDEALDVRPAEDTSHNADDEQGSQQERFDVRDSEVNPEDASAGGD